jgi:hydrogenase-4 membrane subunit HyfE
MSDILYNRSTIIILSSLLIVRRLTFRFKRCGFQQSPTLLLIIPSAAPPPKKANYVWLY